MEFQAFKPVSLTVIQKCIFLSSPLHSSSRSELSRRSTFCTHASNCCCFHKHIYFESGFASYWRVAEYGKDS
jgi:hypothetical protein